MVFVPIATDQKHSTFNISTLNTQVFYTVELLSLESPTPPNQSIQQNNIYSYLRESTGFATTDRLTLNPMVVIAITSRITTASEMTTAFTAS
jgi:hypothetical protein